MIVQRPVRGGLLANVGDDVVLLLPNPDTSDLRETGIVKAWLGLGSNLQQPALQIREALDRLGRAGAVRVIKVSSFYRTPPWGDENQEEFINAVAQIETDLEPLVLLKVMQSIENDMGRQRSGRRWGPRLIDLDLLLYGDQKYCSDQLELPHPRMFERAFVLVPLFELDQTLAVPGHGPIGKLLKGLDCRGISKLKTEGLD
jgi:2-amino-4-hydroxy-6-hydroxymethyldihydropteridine diphosphokinase